MCTLVTTATAALATGGCLHPAAPQGPGSGRHRHRCVLPAHRLAPQSAPLSSVTGGAGAKAQTRPTAPGLASTLARLCLSRGQLHQAPHGAPARATSAGGVPQLRPPAPWQGRCHLAGQQAGNHCPAECGPGSCPGWESTRRTGGPTLFSSAAHHLRSLVWPSNVCHQAPFSVNRTNSLSSSSICPETGVAESYGRERVPVRVPDRFQRKTGQILPTPQRCPCGLPPPHSSPPLNASGSRVLGWGQSRDAVPDAAGIQSGWEDSRGCGVKRGASRHQSGHLTSVRLSSRPQRARSFIWKTPLTCFLVNGGNTDLSDAL